MDSLTAADRDRIAGRAAFAATAFATGVGVIAALERVGAPDGLIEALGPLLALAGLGVIGLTNRAASLTDFLAARRAIPAFYAGLAFAVVLGGIALALASGAEAGRPPALAIAIGAALAGLVVTPVIRAANVSSAIDVLATRFPAFPARAVFAAALLVCGLLTAAAGFRLATQSLVAAVDGSTGAATAFVIVSLAFTLVPGGQKSAVWTNAASGGGVLLIAVFGAAMSVAFLPSPSAPLDEGLQRLTGGGVDDPLAAAAVAAALAFFFPLLPAGVATPSWREARRAGFAGLLLTAVGLGAGAIALPLLAAAPASAAHTSRSLLSTVAWLPSLALARAGALTASRSVGIDLAHAYSRLTVLSSRRIAFGRLTMLAVIAACPLMQNRLPLSPERSLILALAICLALLAPPLILALALPARARSASALVALLVSAATAVVSVAFGPKGYPGVSLLEAALIAGAAGLVAGAFAAAVYPADATRRPLPPADPFVDLPFDTVDLG